MEPETLAELQEATAEELIARGERLLKLGRELLVQSSRVAGVANGLTSVEDGEMRSVGRLGAVNEALAIQKARELGRGREFTRSEFGEALGLKSAATSRWLAKLIEREHPVIERTPRSTYVYLEPPTTVTSRPRRLPAEVEAIDRSADLGVPVPVEPMKRANKGTLSVAGQGHRVRQRQKRFEQNVKR